MKRVTLGILVLIAGCNRPKSSDERIKLYNEVLDQIIMDDHYGGCFELDEKTEREIYNNFIEGRIDKETYLKIGDSLTTLRKNTIPKCILNYRAELKNLNLKGSNALLENINDAFLKVNFPEISIYSIIDTLALPAQLIAGDLEIDYLDIVPHSNQQYRSYGDGIGVISFSRIFFNEELNRAILYYEFSCGPDCGTGEIIFIVKENNRWLIKKNKNIWTS